MNGETLRLPNKGKGNDMKRNTTLALMGMLVLVSWAGTAQAALTAYEGFDYTAGENVDGQGSATAGWAGAWGGFSQGHAVVSDGGLSYTDGSSHSLSATGNAMWIEDGYDDASRDLSSGVAAGSDVWVSYLLDGADFAVGSGLATQLVLWGGDSETDTGLAIWSRDRGYGGCWEFVLSANGSSTYVRDLTGDDYLVPGGTILLVAHIDNGETTSGTISADIWLNPADLTAADLGTPYVSFSATGGSATDAVGTLTNHNSGGWDAMDLKYDEIRLGDTLADVLPIPEPASMALLAVGGLVTAVRRRRA